MLSSQSVYLCEVVAELLFLSRDCRDRLKICSYQQFFGYFSMFHSSSVVSNCFGFRRCNFPTLCATSISVIYMCFISSISSLIATLFSLYANVRLNLITKLEPSC